MWPPTPVSVLPRNLLEMQILGPHQELLTQARRGEGGAMICVSTSPPHAAHASSGVWTSRKRPPIQPWDLSKTLQLSDPRCSHL